VCVCVCVCSCANACACVCMCMYVRPYVCVRMRVCEGVCMCVFVEREGGEMCVHGYEGILLQSVYSSSLQNLCVKLNMRCTCIVYNPDSGLSSYPILAYPATYPGLSSYPILAYPARHQTSRPPHCLFASSLKNRTLSDSMSNTRLNMLG
jgi:hypothetical protein